jgi:hypothetical protein
MTRHQLLPPWGGRLLSLAFAICTLCTAPTLCTAADTPETDEKPQEKEPATLHESMEKIGTMYTELARAFRAPDPAAVDEYLVQAKKFKAEVVRARTFEPSGFAALSADDRAAMRTDFHKEMDATLKTIDAFVLALTKQDLPEATAQVRKLRLHRTEAHKKFQVDD